MKKIVFVLLIVISMSNSAYALLPFVPNPEITVADLRESLKEVNKALDTLKDAKGIKKKQLKKQKERQNNIETFLRLGNEIYSGNPKVIYIKSDKNKNYILNKINNNHKIKKKYGGSYKFTFKNKIDNLYKFQVNKINVEEETEVKVEGESYNLEYEKDTINNFKIQKTLKVLKIIEKKQNIASAFGDFYADSPADLMEVEEYKKIFADKYNISKLNQRFKEDNYNQLKETKSNLLKDITKNIYNNDANAGLKVKDISTEEFDKKVNDISQKYKLKTQSEFYNLLAEKFIKKYNNWHLKDDKWVKKKKINSNQQNIYDFLNQTDKVLNQIANNLTANEKLQSRVESKGIMPSLYKDMYLYEQNIYNKLQTQLNSLLADRQQLIAIYSLLTASDKNSKKLNDLMQ